MSRLPISLLAPLLLASPSTAQAVEELQVGPFACARSLRDPVTGSCIQASTLPGLGKLVPHSLDFNVSVGTGYVGLGTTSPSGRLHIEEFAGTYGALIDQHAPGSVGLLVDVTDTSLSGSTGLSVRTRDTSGTGIVVGTGGVLLAVPGSAVSALTTATTGARTAGIVGVAITGTRDDAGVQGVNYSFTDGNGVEGLHLDLAGTGAGVHGSTFSTAASAAGSVGVVEDTAPGSFSAGVRGINRGTGALGIGVHGSQDGVGWGVYGESIGPGIGVHGKSPTGGFGVFSSGDMGASGVKSFVQPHPLDASKEIRFVCLEGNESGTYFRGSARVVAGRAVIEVPEDFRLVSERDSLTVQITSLGPVFLWVESKDLESIVVRGAEDVEFDYFVNGVRRGFGDFATIRENRSFVPRQRGVAYGAELPDGLRRLLQENGTLRPDGTPDEATARRLGWELHEPAEPARSVRAPDLVPVTR